MIFVSMVIDATPESADALAVAMQVMMDKTRPEAGCVIYSYSRDLDSSTRFHLTEIWASEPDMDAHIDADHAYDFVEALNAHGKIVAMKAFRGETEKMRIRSPAPRGA